MFRALITVVMMMFSVYSLDNMGAIHTTADSVNGMGLAQHSKGKPTSGAASKKPKLDGEAFTARIVRLRQEQKQG